MRGALALAAALGVLLDSSAAHAAEYRMATVAHYLVNTGEQRVEVSVDVTFTNTTPDPAGQLSGFDRIDIAIHPGATDVLARDATGPLGVAVEERDGGTVASVKPRARVRYTKSTDFTLSYRLVGGQAPGVQVRPQLISMPAWGFGTASEVTVDVPSPYAVSASGDAMMAIEAGEMTRLSSGPISDPTSWLVLVTATQPASYETTSRTVALASGTVDLQVRAWADDPAWGARVAALLERALPVLEEAIGLPYARVGPLVVTEAATGGGAPAEPSSPSSEILVAFDEPEFTLLHQAVHVWIGQQLASDRWIREGLASHFAAAAAERLSVPLPYEPAERATELAAHAIPLAAWGLTPVPSAADAYAYAAAWAFVDRIATAAGEINLVTAIGRVAAGRSAYDQREPDPTLPAGQGVVPVDTRRFLDQLAAVSGVDLADAFRDVIFAPAAGVELILRGEARAAYERLLAAAGDWGAPEPIRFEMTEWRFDDARTGIDAALAWLVERDRLVERITAASLTAPDRLRDQYAASGGGARAIAELEAERLVVEAYAEVLATAEGDRGWLEVIGLVGRDDSRASLSAAARSFAAGDLREAAAIVDATALRLSRATADGVVRVIGLAMVAGVSIALARLAIRRRRGSHYTAAT